MDNGYWDKLYGWLVENGGNFIVNLIAVLIILLVGRLLIDWACRALQRALQRAKNVSELMEGFILNISRKALWVLVLLVVCSRLGVPIVPFITSLGVAGFILGFAFQETLSNLAAGVMIALNQPFTVGDFVDTGGITGVVREMNMMATTLSTPDNKKVVIPNKSVWGSAITNYTALDTRRVDLVVGISYSDDIDKAKEVIQETLKNCELILDDPAPTVAVLEMADSSVNLVVRPWCETEKYWDVYFAANQAVKEALDKHGITIPFPQMDVHHFGMAPEQLGAS